MWLSFSLRKRITCTSALVAVLGGGFTPALLANDLMELWQIAEENDPKYQSAFHNFQADKEIIQQTRADLLPTLSLQYDTGSVDEVVNASQNTAALGPSAGDEEVFQLSLTQSVFDYSRWQRYGQAKISANRAAVEYALSKQQLMLKLTENYFLVLESGDQLESIDIEKTALLKHYDSLSKKQSTGLARREDVQDARARYLDAVSREVELQGRLADSRYALRESLGALPDELAKLKDDVSLEMPVPEDPDQWVERAVRSNPEIQILNLSVSEADKEISALRGGHYPTLDLVYSQRNEVTAGGRFGGSSDVDTTRILLQFKLPLYAGGKTSSQVRQAVERRSAVLQERDEKLRQIERLTHEAYQKISQAIVQINALEQSVEAQEIRLRSKTVGYESGQTSLVEILDVEQELSNARQKLIKARYDYVLNALRLKYASGGLEVEDLAAFNNWLVSDNS